MRIRRVALNLDVAYYLVATTSLRNDLS